MLERLPPPWRNLALGALGLAVLLFAWSIRSVVNPILVGYLLAYVLHPLVVRLEGLGFSRRSAVNLIFLSGFLLAVGIAAGLGLQTRALVRDVIHDETVRERIGERFEGLQVRLAPYLPEGLLPDVSVEGGEDLVAQGPGTPPPPQAREEEATSVLEALVGWTRGFVLEHEGSAQAAGRVGLQAAGGLWQAVKRLLGAIVAIGGLFVLVPLYTYYLLFELGRVHAFFRRYLPGGERERLARVAGQIGEVLASFFRGRMLVCLLKGAAITLGLWIAGIPYAFLFGMTSGFLSLIPFVGPMVGFACAFVIGVIDHGLLGALVRAGVVFALAEVLEGYLLIPYVLGDSLGLHPVVVLFALLAGGSALGMFGVLISLPLVAALVILFRELVLPALEEVAKGGEP